jgi:LAS superfamily LD-carboxypeptidase LdcB
MGHPEFSIFELTGRARTHVVDLTEPRCSLHRDVVEPFLAMRRAAAEDGIDLVPFSSFRDFDKQLDIWNAKARGQRDLRGPDGELLDAAALDEAGRVEAILCWSALPGASRHHWGTDLDVLDRAALPPGYRVLAVPQEFAADGVFARLDAWLAAHAARFGFYRPYTTWRGGVRPEPWHISHAPVASAALAQYSEAVLRQALEEAEIDGRAVIEGRLAELVTRYVMNVDPPPAAALSAAGAPRPA